MRIQQLLRKIGLLPYREEVIEEAEAENVDRTISASQAATERMTSTAEGMQASSSNLLHALRTSRARSFGEFEMSIHRENRRSA